MPRPALAFSIVSLLPVPLLVSGATLGGVWGWIALGYLTLFTFGLDQLIATSTRDDRPDAEFPAADWLSIVLAISHFALLGLVVHSIASGRLSGPGQTVALFLAAGLFFGQVSNSNAHELIHRASRPLHSLGKWVFISMLFGHHTSAHPKVHHRYVASDRDPNSARLGETYYSFAARAWRGSFLAGYRAERALLAGRRLHPYVEYFMGAILICALAYLLGGWLGVAVLFGLAIYAQSQLLISDYVQHYGLRRRVMPDGKLEPVADCHSWNAPHWFSSHLMLNAPRHSDHHAHPSRPYPDLALPGSDQVPTLPYSLPVMSVLALFPPVWRRLMDGRVAAWTAKSAPNRAA